MIDMLVWMKNMEEPMYMMWVYADTDDRHRRHNWNKLREIKRARTGR